MSFSTVLFCTVYYIVQCHSNFKHFFLSKLIHSLSIVTTSVTLLILEHATGGKKQGTRTDSGLCEG